MFILFLFVYGYMIAHQLNAPKIGEKKINPLLIFDNYKIIKQGYINTDDYSLGLWHINGQSQLI